MRFKNKVVLITGASRGLGKAMAEGFAEEGAKIIVSSRKLDACKAVVGSIKARGGDAIAIDAHLGSTEKIDSLLSKVYSEVSKVDILINNAGINLGMASLSDTTVAMFDKMVSVNLRGPWYLSSRIAPKMGDSGGGCIINILSIAAMISPPNMGLYAATKAALASLTEVMAQEWASLNIRVNALAPGSYRSEMTNSAIESIEGYEQSLIDAALIPRIADSKEILSPIFYLATEAYTTGITLVADGGVLAKR